MLWALPLRIKNRNLEQSVFLARIEARKEYLLYEPLAKLKLIFLNRHFRAGGNPDHTELKKDGFPIYTLRNDVLVFLQEPHISRQIQCLISKQWKVNEANGTGLFQQWSVQPSFFLTEKLFWKGVVNK